MAKVLIETMAEINEIIEKLFKKEKELIAIVSLASDTVLEILDNELNRLEAKLGKKFMAIMGDAVDKAYAKGGTVATQQIQRIKKVPKFVITTQDKVVIKLLKDTDFSKIRSLSVAHIAEARAIFVEGLSNGLSQKEIIQEIMNRVNNTEYNARRIVRTELTRTANTAAQKRYLLAGITFWQWNTAQDERVCPICGPLHGIAIKIGDKFNPFLTPVGKKYMGNKPLIRPPVHPFCRCGVAPAFNPTKIKKKKVVKPVEVKQKFEGFTDKDKKVITGYYSLLPVEVKQIVKVLNGKQSIVRTKGRLIDNEDLKSIVPPATLSKYKNADGMYISADVNRVFISSTSPNNLILHETGHAIYDEYLSSRLKTSWRTIHELHVISGDFVTPRAAVNEEEHFADALRIYIIKPELLKFKYPEIYEFLLKKIFFGKEASK